MPWHGACKVLQRPAFARTVHDVRATAPKTSTSGASRCPLCPAAASSPSPWRSPPGPALSLAADPIKIGLVTALSGQSARAGEAITRGLTVAIDEINAKGGVLGRPLELVRRDDEGNPAKGVTAARELIFKEKVAVLFGGLDTPVSMAIVPVVNQEKVPFMGPWAAGTPITKNGANPNFVFRVSAVDEIVDKAMLQYAQKTFKATKPGLILVNNPWGESNEKGLNAALAAKGMKAVGVEKFEAQRRRRRAAADAPEGRRRRRRCSWSATSGRRRRW